MTFQGREEWYKTEESKERAIKGLIDLVKKAHPDYDEKEIRKAVIQLDPKLGGKSREQRTIIRERLEREANTQGKEPTPEPSTGPTRIDYIKPAPDYRPPEKLPEGEDLVSQLRREIRERDAVIYRMEQREKLNEKRIAELEKHVSELSKALTSRSGWR